MKPSLSVFLAAASGILLATTLQSAPWQEIEPASFAPVPAPARLPGTTELKEEKATLASAKGSGELLELLELSLSDAEKEALDQDGFLLLPIERSSVADPMDREPREVERTEEEKAYFPDPQGGLAVYADEMLGIYPVVNGWKPEPWRNTFVTADAVLHAWHRFFSSALEEVESSELRPRLDDFLNGLLASIEWEKAASGAELKPHWDRLHTQIAVAWALLGDDGAEPRRETDGTRFDDQGNPLPIEIGSIEQRLGEAAKALPGPLAAAMRDEVALVLAQEGFSRSPLFGDYDENQQQDYTQFTPRSHYTKNQLLRGYFRSMMYLGRNGWPLGAEHGDGLVHTLLLGHALSAGKEGEASPLALWKEVQDLTAFFAGASDDIDYRDLRAWLAGNLDLAQWSPDQALDGDVARKLAAALGQLQRPAILSQVRGAVAPGESNDEAKDRALQFRLFGQRFTLDGKILADLTPPLAPSWPATPTALYVPAAFGDAFARRLAVQHAAGARDGASAETVGAQLDQVTVALATVPDSAWFSSLASKHLHVVGQLARPRGPSFPAFMRTPAWEAKQVETFLGSYTQLKHDTVLYAKQVYAEGDGGFDGSRAGEDALPYGFVQPDLPFWAELQRLVEYTFQGFSQRQILPLVLEEWGHLARFRKDVERLRALAEKTATGARWSAEERLWLASFDLVYMSEPVNMDAPGPDDGKTALVTDIHTNAVSNEILYQGLGRPSLILALVGDAGRPRLVVGGAYDYYEFAQPLGQRLTDQEWQKRFYRLNPETPPRPAWVHPRR